MFVLEVTGVPVGVGGVCSITAVSLFTSGAASTAELQPWLLAWLPLPPSEAADVEILHPGLPPPSPAAREDIFPL